MKVCKLGMLPIASWALAPATDIVEEHPVIRAVRSYSASVWNESLIEDTDAEGICIDVV